jgi:hypothetical protein
VVEIPFKTDYAWRKESFFEVVLVPVDNVTVLIEYSR